MHGAYMYIYVQTYYIKPRTSYRQGMNFPTELHPQAQEAYLQWSNLYLRELFDQALYTLALVGWNSPPAM